MEYFCTFTRVKLKKQYFYFYWSNILVYVSVLLLKYLICVLWPPLAIRHIIRNCTPTFSHEIRLSILDWILLLNAAANASSTQPGSSLVLFTEYYYYGIEFVYERKKINTQLHRKVRMCPRCRHIISHVIGCLLSNDSNAHNHRTVSWIMQQIYYSLGCHDRLCLPHTHTGERQGDIRSC